VIAALSTLHNLWHIRLLENHKPSGIKRLKVEQQKAALL
jgi:hypothetical protein